MKFTLVALLAVACLLSAHAASLAADNMDDMTMDFMPKDLAASEDMETVDFWIFSSIWWAIKVSLRTVKGFNCIISWVLGIQKSALQFNASVVSCGVTAGKDITNLVNANLKIISTCNDIINLKSNVCSSTENDSPSITNSCAVKTLSKVFTLYKQVKNAISLAKKIPQTGTTASTCVNDSVNTLISYYTQFPQNIVACSKLTS